MAEDRTKAPDVPQADVQAERDIAQRAGQQHQPAEPNKEEAGNEEAGNKEKASKDKQR